MNGLSLLVAECPGLRIEAFVSTFPRVLGELPAPERLSEMLRADADPVFRPDERLRGDIRDLLRHAGYKPTGRGKPASEYLVRAAGQGALASINAAVDACNVASLHGGFPISVIDIDLATPPFRIAPAEPGARYVFNAAGQEIDVTGLLCLHDADGPCANPVKDAQRTKTSARTLRTLSIVWGTQAHADRLAQVAEFYRGLVVSLGARVDEPARNAATA